VDGHQKIAPVSKPCRRHDTLRSQSLWTLKLKSTKTMFHALYRRSQIRDKTNHNHMGNCRAGANRQGCKEEEMTNALKITNAFVTVNTWVDTNSGSGSATSSMITFHPLMYLAIITGLIIVALTVWFAWSQKSK
jgi:hypothetical protein